MIHRRKSMYDSEKNAKRARAGALVFVLGLLCVLAAVTTANAYVTKTVHTALTDFEHGTFTYTGLVDLPAIEGVQLLPIGVDGGGWALSDQTLEEPLTNFVAAASDGRIYVAGGTRWDLSVNEKSWVAEVGTDGAIGSWLEQAPMPTGRKAAGFALHELNQTTSILYVVGGMIPNPSGGWPPFIRTSTILGGHIDRATGALTGWEEEAVQLPVALQNPSVVVHDGFLYVVGGYGTPPSGEYTYNKVLCAPINSDGSLGEFVETSPLTSFEPLTGLYYGLALVYDSETTDTLYFIGGLRNDDSTATTVVQFADFVPGGGLTSWTSFEEGNLVLTLWGHGGVYLSDAFEYGEILLIGGIEDVGQLYEPEDASRVVKVALVDPSSTFRLYDWCQGLSSDVCDIGAWQTGMLLDENLAQDGKRAFHVTLAVNDYVYVLGGQGLSQDGDLEAKDTIFVGKLGDVEAIYAPQGSYDSAKIDLERPATLLQLDWSTTITNAVEMSVTMQYRYRPDGLVWSDWTEPVESINGSNAISITSQSSHPEDIVEFQYRAKLSTKAPLASPRLDSVQLYYDVRDPDLAVTKDTGYINSVPLGGNLVYYIHYKNNGGWDAENAVLTEILPDNTTFAGTAGWEQVDTSNVYTYQLGDVPWGQGGTIPFEVIVNSEVPPDTTHILNRVEIDYLPMVDIWDNPIVDPDLGDNVYELSTVLNFEKWVDLTPVDLAWEPDDGIAGVWPEFKVTVVNTGTADAFPLTDGEGFWVGLYIKPAPSEPPEWFSDYDRGYCLDDCSVTRIQYMADVSQLLEGESLDVWFQDLDLAPSPDFPEAGAYDIYVQVDMAFGEDSSPAWGRYMESNEANNILHGMMILGPSRTYLPLVLRGGS